MELTEVTIPYMGSTENVTVNEWLVDVGAAVEGGDPLCDVTTDKADTEIESPAEGILVKQLVGEGAELTVGACIGLIAPAGATQEEVDAAMVSRHGTAGQDG